MEMLLGLSKLSHFLNIYYFHKALSLERCFAYSPVPKSLNSPWSGGSEIGRRRKSIQVKKAGNCFLSENSPVEDDGSKRQYNLHIIVLQSYKFVHKKSITTLSNHWTRRHCLAAFKNVVVRWSAWCFDDSRSLVTRNMRYSSSWKALIFFPPYDGLHAWNLFSTTFVLLTNDVQFNFHELLTSLKLQRARLEAENVTMRKNMHESTSNMTCLMRNKRLRELTWNLIKKSIIVHPRFCIAIFCHVTDDAHNAQSRLKTEWSNLKKNWKQVFYKASLCRKI